MTRKTWTAERTQERGKGAMIAAKAKDLYEKEAKDRQKLSEGRGKKGPVTLPEVKGDSRDKAGKAKRQNRVRYLYRKRSKATPATRQARP